MVRLLAPEGVSSFSHAGHSFDVADDGTLDVADHVVTEARSHGFSVVGDGEVVASPTINVSRDSVLKVLEAMAATPTMRADKLSAAFEGAAARVKTAKTSSDPSKGDAK